jgi:hypothetical protein
MKCVPLRTELAVCAIAALFCNSCFGKASRKDRLTAKWADGLIQNVRQGACSALLSDGRMPTAALSARRLRHGHTLAASASSFIPGFLTRSITHHSSSLFVEFGTSEKVCHQNS